ncbi:hypothetical protein BDP27DRAFT_1357317 [Rhodocollybia butyracea]|uniref:Uncharacterized protein n=1 Tax=Rhodocollybia butyracea TaxID=206335 RepID=A0A9P5UFD8_9AGAR|nr:hypothetical protein BDP27DRAFT_1357317 [Rhodocollybia butyracea]
MFRLSSINTVVSILFLFQVVVQGMPQSRAEEDIICRTGYPLDCPEGYRCCKGFVSDPTGSFLCWPVGAGKLDSAFCPLPVRLTILLLNIVAAALQGVKAVSTDI